LLEISRRAGAGPRGGETSGRRPTARARSEHESRGQTGPLRRLYLPRAEPRMAEPLFYRTSADPGATLTLAGDEAHHATASRRLQIGETLWLLTDVEVSFAPLSCIYSARTRALRIEQRVEPPPKPAIHLACALPRGSTGHIARHGHPAGRPSSHRWLVNAAWCGATAPSDGGEFAWKPASKADGPICRSCMLRPPQEMVAREAGRANGFGSPILQRRQSQFHAPSSKMPRLT
jgi:hypothetical protein